MKKERVDILLVQQGFFDSREKAKRAIMAGIIHNEHEILDKPGTKIPVDTKLFIKGEKQKYVSRGGMKLEKAIDVFNLDINNKIVLDIGASTGGFTDCALQHGASFVYAVDVGTNQLVYNLRVHPSVKSLEKTNFRYATIDLFNQGTPEIAVIDVSFISLKHIFPPLASILKPNGFVVSLIKPQFEAGREEVGKNGIIKDLKVHKKVISNVVSYANTSGFHLVDLDFSPITGGQGNIEFIALFKLDDSIENTKIDIDKIVDNAHQTFGK